MKRIFHHWNESVFTLENQADGSHTKTIQHDGFFDVDDDISDEEIRNIAHRKDVIIDKIENN